MKYFSKFSYNLYPVWRPRTRGPLPVSFSESRFCCICFFKENLTALLTFDTFALCIIRFFRFIYSSLNRMKRRKFKVFRKFVKVDLESHKQIMNLNSFLCSLYENKIYFLVFIEELHFWDYITF